MRALTPSDQGLALPPHLSLSTYLQKAPSPNTTNLGVRVSIYKFGGHTNIQSITVNLY